MFVPIANISYLVPLELKILGVLRRLGRGGSFDECWDGSSMSEHTSRDFFYDFCSRFSQTFYSEYVTIPTSREDIDRIKRTYEKLGFPGAVGSIDAVHVRWDKCPASYRSACKGKEPYPTLAYECIVDHTKRILSATRSHPGARNDKTIIRYDSFMMEIKNGRYKDETFELYNLDGSKVQQKGLYVISDNGYHRWDVLQCPLKHTSNDDAAVWSCALESVRKDVECTFGILKHRFRILRNPIEIHSQDRIDDAFFTCCILNNLLLKYDGYDKRWDSVIWKNEDPDGHRHERYDGRLKRIDDRAKKRAQAAKVDTLRAFVRDDEPFEEDDRFFELRAKLIRHYKVAKAKITEILWLN
jgi:hypothetical protein